VRVNVSNGLPKGLEQGVWERGETSAQRGLPPSRVKVVNVSYVLLRRPGTGVWQEV